MLQSERIFRNEKLKEVSEIAKNNGLKVYTFESDSKYIGQIFFTDGVRIGTCSTDFSSVSFGTVHKPCRECGTGFGFEPTYSPDLKDIEMSFCVAPHWAYKKDAAAVKKWANWEDKASNSGLKYFEL